MTVLVRRRGWAGSVVARLTSVSISGAFIEAPPEAFPLYSVVQLEATPPGGASSRLMSCKAMVARLAGNGVGLVFDQVRPAGLTPLFGPVTAPIPGLVTGPAGPFAVRPSGSPASR